MKPINEQDIARLTELLRRTGEFIAYFELAETKMMEWRQDIEHLALAQQQQFEQQSHALQNRLGALSDILNQAALTPFHNTADETSSQNQEHLLAVKKTEQQLLRQMNICQRELTTLTQHAITQMTQHGSVIITQIDKKLSTFDIQNFYRIANESCNQIENSAHTAIVKSGKLLHSFQWQSVVLTLFTTLVTAFAIGLYASGEYPWESHQHVLNERGAGKVLMNAWSKLTLQEKTKILST